jgi:ribosomal protein S12 methylthiotransferase
VVPVMVDGPSPESDLVWQGRLAGQAPDIDSVVVLDGADPSEMAPGEVIQARIKGARGYDLIAAPMTVPRS